MQIPGYFDHFVIQKEEEGRIQIKNILGVFSDQAK
jgi:hypothetical protein